MPTFLVKEGPLGTGSLVVDSRVVLGRGDADVVIDDPEISRRHAVAQAVGELIEIDDLDSLNGTWVNGRRIIEVTVLRPGDTVRIGQTVLEMADSGSTTTVAVVDEKTRTVAFEGVPLAIGRCPECDAVTPSVARFCAYCGVRLQSTDTPSAGPDRIPDVQPVHEAHSADASSEVEDELRPVTALFADVVGSTSLGERLAPDEVKALIGECVNRMSLAVEQYGGLVAAIMGDGVAGFFGVPVAHEDDPERAAHAALRILDVVGEYGRDVAAAWGVDDFNVRIGINSGKTSVGLVGAADRQFVALGDSTNVAARLQSAAAPGSVVVGEATARRLAHRFVLESLGELTVKGRREPVSAWRLASTLSDARPHAPTPLVGREREIGQLRSAAEELLSGGRGQLLMLEGESGIGKTRLLSELATIVGDRGLWLDGYCRSFGDELLYWPFAELLRRWLGVQAGEAEVAVRTRLRSRLTSLQGIDLETTIARLGALLGLRTADERLPRSPDELADDIRLGLSDLIGALCRVQPVVLVIDDLQWVDMPTRQLVQSLLELTDRAPLLVAVAFRSHPPSEGTRFRLYALEHYPHRTMEASIEPLGPEAASELLGMLMPDDLDAAAGAEVVAQAEGNPLYLEELLRTLIEGGGLERRRRTWTLTRMSTRHVPAALEGLLMARIDHLPEGARKVAQVAAVIGRSFPMRVLAQVAQTENLEREVSVLLRAQVISEMGRDPELVYSFRHGLLKECALSTVTPSRKEELYGAVAGVFEELYEGSRNEYLDVLASYYARSGNRGKALEYLELAGRRALSLNAKTEGETMLRKGLKIAREIGDGATEHRLVSELDVLAAPS